MKISTLSLPDKNALESMGLTWHTDADDTTYISDDLIQISDTAVSYTHLTLPTICSV